MTANYKKELYSLPVEIVEALIAYAKESKKKKSHIVAEAIKAYIQDRERKKLAKEAKSLIGMIHQNTPDIQELKAHRYD